MNGNIIKEIKDILDRDAASIDDTAYKRLMLAAMLQQYDMIESATSALKAQERRVDDMERIVKFPQRHPYAFSVICSVAVLVSNLWFVAGWRKPILSALGLPSALIP
jgi:hypothetical protein